MSDDRQSTLTIAPESVNLALLHPTGAHALAPGARPLSSLMIQPPARDSIIPRTDTGVQYLTQGPPGPIPMSQSIDPSLVFTPGTGAHEAYQANLQRAADVGLWGGQFGTFHGTGALPFERFLDEFMGTGEGAQAYGWGHYVAQRPGVATTYRRQAAGTGSVPVDDQGVGLTGTDLARKYFEPGTIVPGYGGPDRVIKFNEPEGGYGWSVDVRRVAPDADKARAAGLNPESASGWDEMQNRPDLWKDIDFERPRNHATFPSDREVSSVGKLRGWKMGEPGSLLNVWVKPEHEEFLDWDLPFSKQEPGVQEKLQNLWRDRFGIGPENTQAIQPNYNGERIYQKMKDFMWDRAVNEVNPPSRTDPRGWSSADSRAVSDRAKMLASKELDAAGIPGMRFLDQQSRYLPESGLYYSGNKLLPLNFTARAGFDWSQFKDVADLDLHLRSQHADWTDYVKNDPYVQRGGMAETGARAKLKEAREALDFFNANKADFQMQKTPRTYNYVVYNPENLEITHRNGRRLIPVDNDPFAPQ